LGKSKKSDKEFSRIQHLINENRQLKRELAHLRKQISRLDLEGMEAAKQALYEQEEKERLTEIVGESSYSLDKLKEVWACKRPGCKGYLEIALYPKLGQTYYYRACNACRNRTVGKRYDESSVKGIIRK
jgi:hypothetical protein